MYGLKIKKLALAAIFLTIMLVLGYIESLFPISGTIPGIKLGISNSIILLSLYWLGISISCALMIMKVLISSFLFGNMTTIIFGLSGGTLSILIMILLVYVLNGVSPIVAGISGAVMHNVGQVLVAMIIVNNDKMLYYMGILILIGIGTGFVTGTIAKIIMIYVKPVVHTRLKMHK